MITKFDSMFAGCVDMDNVGYGGTPVNDRWFSDEDLATAFDKTQAIAQLMDREAYDTLWLAEHHFQPEGYECIPNILLLIAHLSHLTKRLSFGCSFNISTMWHPLRLAEDFATVDILTKGRVTFGVGRGYQIREVETFGAPMIDQIANRELFEEQVEVLFKAFNQQSFSHHGKYYDIPPAVPYRDYELKEITLVPRPRHRPVECWQAIQSGSQRGLEFMAKHGIKGIISGGIAAGGGLDKMVRTWRDLLAAEGRETELGTDLSVAFHFHIADGREQAIKEAAKYYEEMMKVVGPLGLIPGFTDEQLKEMSDPAKAPYADLPKIEKAVEGGGYLCGSPEDMIETLKELEEKYPGMERVNVSHPVGVSQQVMLEHLERFAKEVIPAFKNRAEVAVPAD